MQTLLLSYSCNNILLPNKVPTDDSLTTGIFQGSRSQEKEKKKVWIYFNIQKKGNCHISSCQNGHCWLKNKNSTCRLTDTKIQDLSVSLDVPFLCLSRSFFSTCLLHTILHITLPPSNWSCPEEGSQILKLSRTTKLPLCNLGDSS